ncbi:MAG TPA: hypothetical protein PKA64_09190 [Myxococcota bacterium]|nr:hypothetical protein [Myxococcota bacterium]
MTVETAAERPWVAIARAAFVAAHALGVLILSIPEPSVRDADLKRPEVQRWFDEATDRVHAWGIDVAREDVEAWSVTWGQRYLAVRDVITFPFATYGNFVGPQQSWRMFGDVPADTAVFFIEARYGKEWRLIHQSRYSDVTWRASWFDQERVRAMFNQFTHKKSRSAWDRIVKWMGTQLPADFPDADAFRMGMRSVDIPDGPTLAETGDLVWGSRFWVTQVPIREGA